ncbi:ATP-binding protein [Pseudobutyrivibrio ruminis]|uniref:ATPase n=1 Tax=Pseudobutyrivibrio ruminis TaxID=46206 RepID=A0A2G3DTJ3_9FIRM|nr:ATP-binding protein [Pseudobutyrivibrio ruminis]PHU34342.1 ATPase [Pseudobutyrivibrio ruminis]
MKLIERNYYLNALLAVKDIPDIKVITGVRRSGKSKLMDALISVISKDISANIVRIKLNLKKNESLLDGDKLYEYIEQQYDDEKNNYLFIDEVQMCDGFERVINSIYEEELYDIYLTGSNAFLLSSDLATLFGGRVFEVKLYPFSFNEYLKYFPSDNVDDAFDDYVKRGGMAGSYLYKTDEDARKYINGIYRTTITKDIVTKFKIENEDLLVMIGNFLMDNVGNQTSIRNVASKLTSGTYKTNDKTVGAYIDYLCRSFLFYPIQRYDIKGKKYLESDKKYYLSDLSFRFSELGTKDADYGHLYENIVALELLRRGYEVYVGKLYEKEVDFVAIKEGEKLYIQVSDDISREETLKRELAPLLSIKDAYPKMIIARTKHDETQHDGIRIVDIARWLSTSQK